jgi:hypothetical protein
MGVADVVEGVEVMCVEGLWGVVEVVEVVEGEGLYKRIERSEEPVRMYAPGEAEYVTAWTGPAGC